MLADDISGCTPQLIHFLVVDAEPNDASVLDALVDLLITQEQKNENSNGLYRQHKLWRKT
jgi:hypothetical protein